MRRGPQRRSFRHRGGGVFIAPALACIVSVSAAAAAPPGGESQPGDYVVQDVQIPMRDGVRLHARVWRPAAQVGALPILLQRSPYGFGPEHEAELFGSEFKALAEERYIFVLEDVRGRFGSEGDFVMLRGLAKSAKGIDEATDTYDTIEWLTNNLAANNGRVGVFGVSYLGWTAAMATIHPHPALKAVSVQAAPDDVFVGDDFHHNGAFRLDYAWEYAAALESDGRTMKPFSFGAEDPYGWLLKQGALTALDTHALGHALPTWKDFVDHPNYDRFWRRQVTSTQLPRTPAIPNLIVAGWWDQEDFFGPLAIYKAQQAHDDDHRNFLVVGPWNHGGWANGAADRWGPFDLGAPTGADFREKVEAPWFRHWLKDQGKLDQPEALVFETGSNRWLRLAAWPPTSGIVRRRLYLQGGGRLSFKAPLARAPRKSTSFVSDPWAPVPYRLRPIPAIAADYASWANWLSDDQAPFAKRADVLTWTTPPLTSDLTIRGAVLARMFASTTGQDADWVVKLIDAYPRDEATPKAERGRQLIITADVLRGRFRSSLADPKPIPRGKTLEYQLDLHSAAHTFKAGHRIVVQVQSSWFPLIDRNPQTYVRNIYKATARDFRPQTHRVFHSSRYPSSIDLMVPTAEELRRPER